MTKPDWLQNIEDLLPAIMDVVKKCDEPFQPKCFEVLLEAVLRTPEHERHKAPATVPGGVILRPSGAGKVLQDLLSKANLDQDGLANLIDLETGDVLVTNLGANKAQMQRTIAILIAIRHLVVDGNLRVPKDELIAQCRRAGAYDEGNFAGHMATAKTGAGVLVFVKDGDGWRVSPPGHAYLIETLKKIAAPAE